ncbi:MAG: homoserine O-succinyltransferase [Candidatus Thiodiazotropha sp. (ex Monitilora ramsayi)]|nr:homoserine O-succinyltransferase [Candidatus Thiodiazotropha sp. (ex Monitilora ramsayi)]
MPLVAHTELPAFSRLREEGQNVLTPERATHQHIRELHIGLLNMMPDAAIEATERQFFRLVGEANPIAQFFLHPFTLKELPRGEKAQAHIDAYYETFEQIKEKGLDALIITGANVSHPNLAQEAFWKPLTEVVDWAHENVTSVLCSCLATHAVVQSHHGQKRTHMGDKLWGVYSHRVMDLHHPLVNDINTRFDVPHSRYNQISPAQFEQAGLKVLVQSEQAGVHLAVSRDGFRVVYFQGHPEYDTISLLKEYKREVNLYIAGKRPDYPPFPEHYFTLRNQAIFSEYRERLEAARSHGEILPAFPEDLVLETIDNTWHDTAEAVIGNWIGLVYQVTHQERSLPFMEGIDPDNPLNLSR